VAAIGPEQAAQYGLSINKNNGIYNHGYKFDLEKKLSAEASYERFKEANRGLRPNLTHVAHNCKVSPYYVKKIERMRWATMEEFSILMKRNKSERLLRPGANSIDTVDSFTLLVLYIIEDTRTLTSYAGFCLQGRTSLGLQSAGFLPMDSLSKGASGSQT
jgi:hypothetical protein